MILLQIDTLLIFCFICLSFLIYNKTKTTTEFTKDEYLVIFDHLNTFLNMYIENIFKPAIDNMKKNYELNIDAQTQSIKLYQDAKKQLIKESISKFLNFLPMKFKNILMKYLNNDGLVFYIYNTLDQV